MGFFSILKNNSIDRLPLKIHIEWNAGKKDFHVEWNQNYIFRGHECPLGRYAFHYC